MPTAKEAAMQHQIDQLGNQCDQLGNQCNQLTGQFNIYMQDSKKAQGILFKKLDDAQTQRNRIEQQVIRTNGRVNRAEDAQERTNERLKDLESDQKESLTFRGKMAYLASIVGAAIVGVIIVWIRSK